MVAPTNAKWSCPVRGHTQSFGTMRSPRCPRSPKQYPSKYRREIVPLVRPGRSLETVGRDFEPSAPTIRNWVKQADINEGRRSDGITTRERKELVERALAMTVKRRAPETVIHHSDHGTQYTSWAFGQQCEEAGGRPSMGSGTGAITRRT